MSKFFVLVVAVCTLTACTLIDDSESPDAAHDMLIARLAEAQVSQAAALALWDRLIVGEQVSCQDVIPVPDPVSLSSRDRAAHPSAETIQTRLNEAIQHLHASSDLWNIECANDQAFVPLEMARAGRENALAASDPLAEAGQLLAAW